MFVKTPDSTKRLRLRYGAAAPSPATGVAHLFAATSLSPNFNLNRRGPTFDEQLLMVDRKYEEKRINEDIEIKDQEIASLVAEKTKLEDDVAEKEFAKEILVEELKTKNIEIASTKNHLEQLQAERKTKDDEFYAKALEIETTKQKIETLKSSIKHKRGAIEDGKKKLHEIEYASAVAALGVDATGTVGFAASEVGWESGSRQDLGKDALRFLQDMTNASCFEKHKLPVEVALTVDSLMQPEVMKKDMVRLWAIMAEGNFAKNAVCPDDWKSSARGNINGLTAIEGKPKKKVAYILVDSLVDDENEDD